MKFYLSVYVATNSQSITRFDCCAAARLLNRHNIQEHEFKKWLVKSGLVWSRKLSTLLLINEKKCLWAEPMFVGQHFKHFCRQLKMDN